MVIMQHDTDIMCNNQAYQINMLYTLNSCNGIYSYTSRKLAFESQLESSLIQTVPHRTVLHSTHQTSCTLFY